jgi:hemolysin D
MNAMTRITAAEPTPAATPDPVPAKRGKLDLSRITMHRDDHAFLPADLEILETPPSPVRMSMIVWIGVMVACTLIWSWFGHIDIVATAQGKIAPTGQTKVIQPLEAGKVAAIHVENGQHVKSGAVLIEMEPDDAKAEETGASSALTSWRAEALRRRAEIDTASHGDIRTTTIDWPADIAASFRQREEKVLTGDLSQLQAAIGGLDAQIQQKTIERDHLDATILAENKLIETLGDRVKMRQILFDKGLGAKTLLLDSQEALQTQQTTLQSQTGQRAQADANLSVLAQERQKTLAAFVADAGQKLSDVQRQIDDFQQRLVKAQLKSGRLALTSPIDGVVMGLSVTTIGQVIGGGEDVMRIVPDGAALQIEAYLANTDVGFVTNEQKAVVKVDAFPFTRYGTINATVKHIALDAIPEPDAQNTEADATKSNKNAKMFAGAQRTQNLVFPITLTPDKTTMNVNARTVPLTPGMSVSIEITTGSRRILEYLFSPVVETFSESMKER